MTDRVLVTGAAGTLGARLLPRLTRAGYRVRALSRRPHESADPATTQWVIGDLRRPDGLRGILDGIDAIVHAATSARHDDVATRALIDAVRAAGSASILYPSIVGCDRIPIGYYRTKTSCENLLSRSGLPVTIVRATQFHDLVRQLFHVQRWSPTLIVPAHTRMQPVDAGEVADLLVSALADGTSGRLPDLGGPEVRAVSDLARDYLRATGRRRRIVDIRFPGAIGAVLREGANITGKHADTRVTFAQFLDAATYE